MRPGNQRNKIAGTILIAAVLAAGVAGCGKHTDNPLSPDKPPRPQTWGGGKLITADLRLPELPRATPPGEM